MDKMQVQYSFVEGSARLDVEDIKYIETNRHKNVFYTRERAYSIYRKLDELEQDFAGKGFVRIHKSYLVNMRYVEKISSYKMLLITGEELSVPKARYPEVKRQYMLFLDEE